jgi:hypothetical protein
MGVGYEFSNSCNSLDDLIFAINLAIIHGLHVRGGTDRIADKLHDISCRLPDLRLHLKVKTQVQPA